MCFTALQLVGREGGIEQGVHGRESGRVGASGLQGWHCCVGTHADYDKVEATNV